MAESDVSELTARRRLTRRLATLLVFCAVTTGVASGCAGLPVAGVVTTATEEAGASSATDPSAEDLVLVAFSPDEEFASTSVRDDMESIEHRAAQALERSGLGYADGWETGEFGYFLYFYGSDHDAMWKKLEPIMRSAPVPLSSVELWPPGQSAVPTIIRFDERGQVV